MIEDRIQVAGFTCRMLRGEGKGSPVIFLHGYLFTSDVWAEIGVLDFLEKEGIPFVALDMPYGAKSSCKPKSEDPNLSVKIVEEIADRKPLIVGASLGGYIALRFSIKNPVEGLLLIAPVRSLEDNLVRNYPLKTKVFIIYGENDKIVPLNEMRELANLLKAELIIYENSDHPAYLNQPERFKNDLIKLYKSKMGK